MAENEIECPACYQEVGTYCPSTDEPTRYFDRHDDLDGGECPESDEIAPEED